VEKGLPHGRHLATGLPVLLRSWSNTLLSVRQVTQRNAGRKTAGIDGEVALTSPARMDLAVRAHQTIRSWKPLPVKRVFIVRREALCCIPNTVGRNLEDCFWVQWLT
jgi:retron-type reverse transcriptase